MYVKGGQILAAERQNQLAGLPIGDGLIPSGDNSATPTQFDRRNNSNNSNARLGNSGRGSARCAPIAIVHSRIRYEINNCYEINKGDVGVTFSWFMVAFAKLTKPLPLNIKAP
eukprot:2359382-Pyramimonas_sp.AAC.1